MKHNLRLCQQGLRFGSHATSQPHHLQPMSKNTSSNRSQTVLNYSNIDAHTENAPFPARMMYNPRRNPSVVSHIYSDVKDKEIFKCDMCKIQTQGEKNWRVHLESRHHLEKVRKKAFVNRLSELKRETAARVEMKQSALSTKAEHRQTERLRRPLRFDK